MRSLIFVCALFSLVAYGLAQTPTPTTCSQLSYSCATCLNSTLGCAYVWNRPGLYNSPVNASCVTAAEARARMDNNQYNQTVFAYALRDAQINSTMGQYLLVNPTSSLNYFATPVPCYDKQLCYCQPPPRPPPSFLLVTVLERSDRTTPIPSATIQTRGTQGFFSQDGVNAVAQRLYTNIRPDFYTVFATAPGYDNDTNSVEVPLGRNASVTLYLARAVCSVLVTVVDSVSNATLSGATVTLTGFTVEPRTTPASGSLLYTSVPAGPIISAAATRAGYDPNPGVTGSQCTLGGVVRIIVPLVRRPCIINVEARLNRAAGPLVPFTFITLGGRNQSALNGTTQFSFPKPFSGIAVGDNTLYASVNNTAVCPDEDIPVTVILIFVRAEVTLIVQDGTLVGEISNAENVVSPFIVLINNLPPTSTTSTCLPSDAGNGEVRINATVCSYVGFVGYLTLYPPSVPFTANVIQLSSPGYATDPTPISVRWTQPFTQQVLFLNPPTYEVYLELVDLVDGIAEDAAPTGLSPNVVLRAGEQLFGTFPLTIARTFKGLGLISESDTYASRSFVYSSSLTDVGESQNPITVNTNASRFINIPYGSLFSFETGDIPNGYSFDSSVVGANLAQSTFTFPRSPILPIYNNTARGTLLPTTTVYFRLPVLATHVWIVFKVSAVNSARALTAFRSGQLVITFNGRGQTVPSLPATANSLYIPFLVTYGTPIIAPRVTPPQVYDTSISGFTATPGTYTTLTSTLSIFNTGQTAGDAWVRLLSGGRDLFTTRATPVERSDLNQYVKFDTNSNIRVVPNSSFLRPITAVRSRDSSVPQTYTFEYAIVERA